MYKSIVVGTLASVATSGIYHPVNPQITAEIKEKDSWKAMEKTKNLFAKKTYFKIKNILGAIITQEVEC
jgi:hypothetical protein